MRTLLLIILSLVYLSANGQTFEKKGRFVSDPLYDTIVTVFIGSDTTGGGGIGLISDGDTSYVYATSDCLTILADTIRLDGYIDLPATITIDSITSNYISYPATPRQPTSAGVTNTGTIYRDTSNVVAVDRCLPWTCNDSLDVILTDTTANVGIGTSTPTAALHVEGSVYIYHDSIDEFVTSEFISGSDLYLNESGEYNSGMVIKGTDIAQINIKGYAGVTFNEDVEALESSLVIIDTTEALGAEEYIYVRKDKVNIKASDGVDVSTIDVVPDKISLSTSGTLLYSDGNEADGYVLTSDANGNATWQDHTAFGEMGFGDSTSTQELTQNVWHVVTNANKDLWSESVIDTHEVTYTNDSIVIQKDGTYALNLQLSVDGSANSIIRLGIYINGSLACTCTGYQELINNMSIQINYINIDGLSAGDVIQPVITNTANDNDVNAIAGKLTIHKID